MVKKKRRKKVGQRPSGLPLRNGEVAKKAKRKRKVITSDTKEEVSPGQHLHSVGRGFRIGFSGLSQSRKIDEKNAAKMLKTIDADSEQISISKKLFSKHPSITKVNSAKGKINAFFEFKTLPFPESGVRLLPLDTSGLDFENMSEIEITKTLAQQMDVFAGEMRGLIHDYDHAVVDLAKNWPDVLATAKAKLKATFDESQYPDADDVCDMLKCRFEPYNVDLPAEYGYVSPIERQRALAELNLKFERAAQMQEEACIAAFDGAFDQMLESLTNFQNGTTTRFRNSVIENAFAALEEFTNKTARFGILKGTALADKFAEMKRILTEGGLDKKTLPMTLRKSEEKRVDFVERASEALGAMRGLAEKRQRRSIDVGRRTKTKT
jgi:hypothetical protein